MDGNKEETRKRNVTVYLKTANTETVSPRPPTPTIECDHEVETLSSVRCGPAQDEVHWNHPEGVLKPGLLGQPQHV